MALIAGASSYVNAANLAISQGRNAVAPSLLGDSAVDLLDSGRRFGARGIGLSARSRTLTKQFLNNSSSLSNALLSAPAEANTTENLKKRILAIRASLPTSALAPDLSGVRGTAVDTTA